MNKIILISLVIFFTICSKSWAEESDSSIYIKSIQETCSLYAIEIGVHREIIEHYKNERTDITNEIDIYDYPEEKRQDLKNRIEKKMASIELNIEKSHNIIHLASKIYANLDCSRFEK